MTDPVLMHPGPAPLPDRVRLAMAEPMVSHRTEPFEEIYAACQEGLRLAFGTASDPVLLNASGRGALEAAVANCVPPDGTVACVVNGHFGGYLEGFARRYVGEVRIVTADWGAPVDPADVDAALDDGVDAVAVVHAETSTGVLNPVADVASLAADYGALSVVDGVTSVGGEDVRVDEWGIDLAATGSQKCLGAPPGLSAMTVSDAARERLDPSNAPAYLDLAAHLEAAADHQTPNTSSVPLFYGLREAVAMLAEEGIDARIDRQRRLADALRAAADAMGLGIVTRPGDSGEFANAVVVIELPEGLDTETAVEGMEARGVSIRGGLGELAGRTIRIGTMGAVDAGAVLHAIAALQATLEAHGVPVENEGLAAAREVLV